MGSAWWARRVAVRNLRRDGRARDTGVARGRADSRSGRRRRWLSLAGTLTVGGVVLSVAGATALARSNAGRSWKAAQQSSGQIASTLALAIQHEQDLVAAATSFVLTVPHASEADLVQWAATVQAFQRYPELQGLGHSVIVPAAQLPAFSAQVSRDASGGSGSGGALQVVPPGPRPTYCLDVVVIARSAAFASPPGLDYCVASPGLLATRDTGEAVYQPLYIGSHDAGLGISAFGVPGLGGRGRHPRTRARPGVAGTSRYRRNVRLPLGFLGCVLPGRVGAARRAVGVDGSAERVDGDHSGRSR
jgi:hypothetical protein